MANPPPPPPRRGVRFLSNRMERELPSFSPPSKNEQVLHSIFSNLNSTPEKEGLPIQKLQAKTSESPVSAITEASYHHRSHSKNNKSFDTLNSLDMLNFDYIQSCERQDELEKIIAILHKHKHSKLLLQEAQERLAFLTKLHNVSQIVEVDEPSLNFTLSPGSTKLHGTAFCDTMNTKLLQEPQKEPRNNTSNLKKSFTRTLQDLERAKQEAAALTFSLQTKETKNQTLSQTLQTLQSTHAITLQELQQQRIFLHKQKETQEEIQTKYTKTLDTLSKELKQAKQTTNLVKGAEKALRQQKERLWQEETAKNESLQNELRSAHNNLERMKHRQAKFRMELFRSMGMTLTQWKSMTQRDLLRELTHRIRTLREENRLAQQQTKDYKNLEDRNSTLQTTLVTLKKQNSNLQIDNERLSKKIQDLVLEVASSRAYIDKLLQTTHQTEFGDEKENKYRIVISNLRQQIRKQTSAVSLDLYKVAIDDNKSSKKDLQQAKEKIEQLQQRVIALSSKSPKPTTNSNSPSKRQVRDVATSPSKYLEEQNNKSSGLGKPARRRQSTQQPETKAEHESSKRPAQKNPITNRRRKHTTAITPTPKNDLIGFQVLVPSPRQQTANNNKLSTSNTRQSNENANPTSTTKNTPLRKARQLGGRKALADKLRKMRSPLRPMKLVN